MIAVKRKDIRVMSHNVDNKDVPNFQGLRREPVPEFYIYKYMVQYMA